MSISDAGRNPTGTWLFLVLIAGTLLCIHHSGDPDAQQQPYPEAPPGDNGYLVSDTHSIRGRREVGHGTGRDGHFDSGIHSTQRTKKGRQGGITSPHGASDKHATYWGNKECSSRYTLALSYFDQVTSALRRMSSLQCWASQFDMPVVEPLLPQNSTFLGVPHSQDNPKSSLSLRDLFTLDTWNKYSLRTSKRRKPPVSFSSLISWMEFVQCASRNVIAVQFIHKKMDSRTPPCAFENLHEHWPSLFQPYGFRVVRRVCINMKEHKDLLSEDELKKLIFGDSSDPVTVIFEEWRGIQSDITKGVSINVESSCTNVASSTHLFNIITPSDSIAREAKRYIEKYLKGKMFVTVMLRLERFLIYDSDQGHYSLKELVKTLGCVPKLCMSKQMFVTTDMSMYGSQTVRKHYKNSLTAEYIQQVLDIFFSHDSFLEQEKHFKEISSVNNPAYISTLQKAIASHGDCVILVGGGNFQKQASIWHDKVPSRTPMVIKWMGPETCESLIDVCKRQ